MSAAVVETIQTVTPAGPTPEPPKPEPETPTLTQSQVNALLAEERRKATERATREREQSEAKAKDAALIEQQKFEQLANDRAARITELETETARIETLTAERDDAMAVVNELVEAKMKDAPSYVAEALDGRSAVEKLRYVQKHEASWNANRPQGGRETPRASGGPVTKDDLVDKYLKQAGVVR